MSEPVLFTKFAVPQTRPALVRRPQLLQRLDEGLDDRLTLVSAPAGYGKTTLVAAWAVERLAAGDELGFAWLSLEEADNDPVRFVTYLARALGRVDAALGQALLATLQGLQQPSPRALMSLFIAEIDAGARIVLVLDDYQVIDALPVHQALAFLLEHQPPQLHIVLLTREDPPLPLARLRASGQLSEIRFRDLRFSRAEAASFLNTVMGLNLGAADIDSLETRTEGWIAGLQLAALSLRDRGDAHRFVRSFAGSNRYILDYLIEEVFQQQADPVQEFLLKTAILDRLSAPLCDAVCQRDDSVEVLAHLEQANLFLVPLDESRHWYRYHHLFADLLRHRLSGQQLELQELHRRAGDWLASQGLPAEAMRHLVAAADWPRAAALVETQAQTLLERGQIATLLRWCGAIPDEVIFARPGLCLRYAWGLGLSRRVDAAERYLAPAAEMAQGYPVLRGQILTLQAHLARTRHDVPATLSLSQEALALLPQEDHQARSVLGINLGVAQLYSGDLAAAAASWEKAADEAQRCGNHHALVLAHAFRAQVIAAWGSLHRAAALNRRAMRLGEERQAIPVTGRAHVNLAALLYEWNELDAASRHAQRALELSELSGDSAVAWDGFRLLARISQAQGDAAAALATLQRAQDLARHGHAPPNVHLDNAIAQVQLSLAQGDLARAQRRHARLLALAPALSAPRVDLLANAGCLSAQPGLAAARLLLAQGRREEAARLLAEVYEGAAATGLVYDQVQARAWEAVAAGEGAASHAFWREAQALAGPETYRRTFLEASRAGLWLTGAPGAEARPAAETPGGLLSDRELELLQLLAARLTNAEIAVALTVSTNTVKTHLRHIYEKLDVHDRRAAVSQARALGILQ